MQEISDNRKLVNFSKRYFNFYFEKGTIASKINGTPKGVYLPISKLRSILAVANLLAHNNKNQICYCSQILLECCS